MNWRDDRTSGGTVVRDLAASRGHSRRPHRLGVDVRTTPAVAYKVPTLHRTHGAERDGLPSTSSGRKREDFTTEAQRRRDVGSLCVSCLLKFNGKRGKPGSTDNRVQFSGRGAVLLRDAHRGPGSCALTVSHCPRGGPHAPSSIEPAARLSHLAASGGACRVDEIRTRLLRSVDGTRADPAQHVGITDIQLIIQAYSN